MKKNWLRYVFSAAVCLLNISGLRAQVLDTTFKAPLPQKQGVATAIGIQPDGKIIVAGNIHYFNERRIFGILRLNADGSLDESFEYRSASYQQLRKIRFLSTGEFIGSTQNNLIKIGSNGSLIRAIEMNEIYDFDTYEDEVYVISMSGFKKYDQDIRLVNSFKQNNFFNGGRPNAVAVQNDRVVLAGNFEKVNNEDFHDVAWFDLNGNLDKSFPKGDRTSDPIGSITVMPDGKLVLSGGFINSFDNVPMKGLVRINQDGTVDKDFQTQGLSSSVFEMHVQGSKLILKGSYQINDVYAERIVRIDETGKLDFTFKPNIVDQEITVFDVGVEGEVILGSDLSTQIDAKGIYRLNNIGELDSTFTPKIFTPGKISHAAIYQDKIAVVGDFLSLSGFSTHKIGLLNLDGSVDESFSVGEELTDGGEYNYSPQRVKFDANGSLLVAHENRLLKLDANGNLAKDFYTKGIISPMYFAVDVHCLSDGRMVTTSPNGMFMLNPDGSNDRSFNEDYCCSQASIELVSIQEDNKIIYAGDFYPGNEYDVPRLGRINTDGTLDPSFLIEFEFNINSYDNINFLHVNDEGNIWFRYYVEESEFKPLYKLNRDGKLDSAFMRNLMGSSGSVPSGELMIPYRDNALLGVVNDGTGGVNLRLINESGFIVQNFKLPKGVSSLFYQQNYVVPVWDGDDSIYLIGEMFLTGIVGVRHMVRVIDDPEKRALSTEADQPSFQVYPNPAEDYMRIYSGDVDLRRAQVSILSVEGKLLKELRLIGEEPEYQLDISDLSTGLYIVQVQPHKGQTMTRRVLVR
ncbi:MAG: T9SS type A sorting domain-containing protein [Marinoscillum sp.]